MLGNEQQGSHLPLVLIWFPSYLGRMHLVNFGGSRIWARCIRGDLKPIGRQFVFRLYRHYVVSRAVLQFIGRRSENEITNENTGQLIFQHIIA